MAGRNTTVNRIQAVWDRLGGEEGVDRLLCGELKLVEQPRKTVKLGLHKAPFTYRKALEQAGWKIGHWCDDMFDRIACSQKEVDLDLVVLSVADLGFKNGARYADIGTKAVEFGLELCPAEVGPALCLQYGNQTRGQWLLIAMEVMPARGKCSIFEAGRNDDGIWLLGRHADADFIWGTSSRFVFVKPRKKLV